MSNVWSPARGTTLVGYILPKKDVVPGSDDEDSDTEEEENEPEFLDMDEIESLSSGGQIISTSRFRRIEVSFKDLSSDEPWRVVGRFAFSDPWWEVTCRGRRARRRLFLEGGPSYRLRTAPPEEARSLAALFLTACGAPPDLITEFAQWSPRERVAGLADLLEMLNELAEGEGSRKASADRLRQYILNSEAGQYVQTAVQYPQVMFYLPTLLPRHFQGLVQKAGSNTGKSQRDRGDKLSKLEEMIGADVWKLGFKTLLNSEVGLVRCEASLEAFQACGLWGRIPPPQQDALQVYRQLKRHLRTGSTYMDLEDIRAGGAGRDEPREWEAVRFLKEQGVVVREKRVVALADVHAYEAGIARSLRRLAEEERGSMQLDVGEVLQASLDPDQVRAARMICANPVTVVSGKGGCGKTTVVSLVFSAALEQQRRLEAREADDACRDFQNDAGGSQGWDVPPGPPTQAPQEGAKPKEGRIEVLLTAPTGRAAAILTKRTSFTAFTLHQVLWSFMNAKKDKSGAPQEWKFADVWALVVDEGSLLSVQLLHSVLRMLARHARLRKFVLLGDVRQLPSIEPGNTLHDLFHCLGRVGWATEMRTNHRAESQLIVRNAGLISERSSSLDFDAIVRMDSSPTAPPPEKSFIHIILPEDNTDYYLLLAIQLLLDSAPGLEKDTDSQFIAFRRKECDLINELCCKHYSQHNTRNHKGRLSFQLRDKVCCTKNGYVSDLLKERELERERKDRGFEDDGDEKKKEARERLCNGQIFFITADVTEVTDGRHKKRYLTLDDRESRALTVWFRELQKECKLQHAWARTIHTFQGSEAETIVYVLGKASAVQCWKHVYTAVTRGRRRVYVVSTETDLRDTVVKQDFRRRTRLGELARREFPLGGVNGEEPVCTQSRPPPWETPTQPPTQAPTSIQKSTPTPGPLPGPGPYHPSSLLQGDCASATPMLPGSSQKAGDVHTSLNEDVAFSYAYTWSPMDCVDASCVEEDHGRGVGEVGDSANCEGTPSKQPRLEVEDSPLGSQGLQRLSLDGHHKSRKQIF